MFEEYQEHDKLEPLIIQSTLVSTGEITIDKPPPVTKKDDQFLLFFFLGTISSLGPSFVFSAIDAFIVMTNDMNLPTNLSRSYNIPCSLVALLMCFIKLKKPHIWVPIVVVLLTLCLVTYPIMLFSELSMDGLVIGSLSVMIVIGILSGTLFGFPFAIAPQFGPKSTAAISNGAGVIGVISIIIRAISKAILSDDKVEISATIYLITGILFFVISFIVIIYKFREPIIYEALNPNMNQKLTTFKEAWNIIKVVWPYLISCALHLFLGLTLFPGYVLQVRQFEALGTWTTVLIIAIGDIGGYIGRCFLYCYQPKSGFWGWFPSIYRQLYFAVFMLSRQRVIDVPEPLWTILWMIPYSLCGGYFISFPPIFGTNHPDLTYEQRIDSGFIFGFAGYFGVFAAMGVTFLLPKPIL